MESAGFTDEQLARLRYWRQRELWKFTLVLQSVENYLQSHDYYTLALVNWDEVFAEIDKAPDPDKPNPDVTEADLVVLEANFLGDRGLTQEELEKLDGLDANRAQLHRLLQSLACFPEVRPRMSFESGYFQPLEWRRGHGTKGTNDRGDHRGSA